MSRGIIIAHICVTLLVWIAAIATRQSYEWGGLILGWILSYCCCLVVKIEDDNLGFIELAYALTLIGNILYAIACFISIVHPDDGISILGLLWQLPTLTIPLLLHKFFIGINEYSRIFYIKFIK